MGNIALQVERSAAGSIASTNDAVVFDTIVYTTENIEYDFLTGTITINHPGRYIINWWVATQLSPSNSIAFALSPSQGNPIEGNSPLKTGQVNGFGIFNVTSVPFTVNLNNTSTGSVLYSSIVPVKASLVIFEDESAGNQNNTSLCFSITQLSNVIAQLLVLYPTTVFTVFTTNYNPVMGIPYQLYTSPEGDDPGLLILINEDEDYELIPIMAITAIYLGEDAVYNPSITYLPPPDPLPKGCDTNFISAIYSYFSLFTDVVIQTGVSIEALGIIYKNEYGVLVLADVNGNTPIFISVPKIARITTEQTTTQNKTNYVNIKSKTTTY